MAPREGAHLARGPRGSLALRRAGVLLALRFLALPLHARLLVVLAAASLGEDPALLDLLVEAPAPPFGAFVVGCARGKRPRHPPASAPIVVPLQLAGPPPAKLRTVLRDPVGWPDRAPWPLLRGQEPGRQLDDLVAGQDDVMD